MKNLRTNKTAKRIAFVLAVLCLTAALCCAVPLQWLSCHGASDGYQTYKDQVENMILTNWLDPVTTVLYDVNEDALTDTDQRVRTQLRKIEGWTDNDPNLFYTIRGEDGRLILSSEELGDYRAKYTQTVTLPETVRISEIYRTAAQREAVLENLYDQYEEVNVLSGSSDEEGAFPLTAACVRYDGGEPVAVNGFIRAEMTPTGQTWQQLNRAAALYSARPIYQIILPGGLVIGLLCLAFLIWASGREKDRAGVVLNAFDRRVPPDLLLPVGIVAVLVWLPAGLEAGAGDHLLPVLFPVLPWCLLCLLLAAGLYALLSAVRQIASGELTRDRLFLVRAGRWLGRGLKGLGRGLAGAANRLPLYWQAALLFLAFAFLEGLSVVAIHGGAFLGAVLWFLLKALELAGIVWMVLSLRRLQEGGRALAAGNLDYKVDLAGMKGPFRAHGEHLNSIRDAIQTNLEERMKSERMKTELITNVSHDIKTPLTSIVSYVDLLKKQDMPTPEAREYLEVLDRQSARLKKLTEDLVEASKASAGTISVDLAPTDVNVFLAQSAGEYQERLRDRDLTLVLAPAEGAPVILADGRLLWRVFDNLLSNIRKYAQPGTRVYLSCQTDGDRVTVLFRNISSSPLNITAEELMERFVRGDEARSSEGSGLGLTIARDLTRLQGGTFGLEIDGDLFKARLAFPLAKR